MNPKAQTKRNFLILLGAVLAVVLIVLCVWKLFSCTVTVPNDRGEIFSINASLVKSVAIIDGNTGEQTAYTDSEDVQTIVSALNGLRYDSCEDFPEWNDRSGYDKWVVVTLATGQTFEFDYSEGVVNIPWYHCYCDTVSLDAFA
ncbi:MAG: hypothetical protein LIO45_01545 [Clostridiales bacterium]|nr:hypothetical protein [Clostridiales bacterium]